MAEILSAFRRALLADAHVGPAHAEVWPRRLARAAVQVLAAGGVGISLVNQRFRVPLGASSPQAEFAERLQFTVGEGPCLQAAAEKSTICCDEQVLAARWPAFHHDLTGGTEYRSIISVPLKGAALIPGAVDVYLVDSHAAGQHERQVATELSRAIVDALTGHPNYAPALPILAWLNTPLAIARTNVWIAIGMLNAHLQIAAMTRSRSFADTPGCRGPR